MELIFVFARIVYYIVVLPVLWVAGMLAGFFYPFEGDKRYDALVLVFSSLIFMGLAALLIFLMAE